jgi:hypothetical protein
MGMECKACKGKGKLTDMLGDIGKCYDCNGTGMMPRFIYETVESYGIEQYLKNDPNPCYRMVSATLDAGTSLFHIIFEEKE